MAANPSPLLSEASQTEWGEPFNFSNRKLRLSHVNGSTLGHHRRKALDQRGCQNIFIA